MTSTCRVHHSLFIAICVALTGCNHDELDDTASTAESAPLILPVAMMGKVTALHVGIVASGRFPVANCYSTNSQQQLSRSLQLNVDGSISWLDTSSNDTVLMQLIPSDSLKQNRSVQVYRAGNNDTANSYSVSFYQYADPQIGSTEGSYEIFGYGSSLEQVDVTYMAPGGLTTISEHCGTTQTITSLAALPMIFSTAVAHEMLSSLVSLNGGNLSSAPYSFYSATYASVTVATEGQISTVVANTTNSTPWGTSWVEDFSPNGGIFFEQYFSGNDSNSPAGYPGNPTVSLTVQHPTLMMPYGTSQIGQPVGFSRNTSGSGSPVKFEVGGNS